MPNLWILSDLHLENSPYPDAFDPPRPDFDVLVCPGDVWGGRVDLGFATLRRLAGDNPVVTVLGNHEHWNGITDETLEEARLIAGMHGITLLEGDEATIEGVRFVGCTLWSDYELAGGSVDPEAETGEAVMVPHEGGEHWLRVMDAIQLHEQARNRLVDLIDSHEDGTKPLVVVTHHAPVPECIPPQLERTPAAGNSASDLSDLTDTGTIALWAHGHTHWSIDMVRPGGTRILCNPAGRQFDNPEFNEGLVVEVG